MEEKERLPEAPLPTGEEAEELTPTGEEGVDGPMLTGEEPPEGILPTEEAPDASPAPAAAGKTDYEALAKEDLAQILRLRPEYGDAKSLSDLPFALRFARFRDLGLSVEEALGAADPIHRPRESGKEHLRSVAPRRSAGRERIMSHGELEAARSLFGDRLSDREIADLYRRATR